jgi:signal transduction histidine kinase
LVTIFKGRTSLQFKFGASYIVIILAVLVLLNSYPLLVSQNLVFRSKRTAMFNSVKVIETSLSGLARLTEENVGQALGGLRETGVSRLLVTDTAGRILYDSRETGNARGLYAFYTEVAQALSGNDAFYCRYDSKAFISRSAEPLVYHNQIIGAIYAYEYDTEQAELLQSFQQNLMVISAVIGVLVILLSMLLSRLFTRQISDLLQAIRSVREGAYSRRANVRGTDEIAQIAAEFNSLTDRLQTTENARRRFVSDASHELKTPLAGIRLLTDSILQTEQMDPATVREFVTDIGQEAERLSRISEDLLRLTRLDSDAMESPGAVPVGPVLERVVRMLGMVAREKEVSLSWEADPQAVVLATEDDVHQILYNLMENAIKYSSQMGFVHTIASVEEQAVVIRVEDNGIGIPAEDMDHIFERFYRVDKTRSRQVGGTGLGLSIVRDTVVRRGGTVSVSPRAAGRGSVFTVRLPLAEGGGDA